MIEKHYEKFSQEDIDNCANAILNKFLDSKKKDVVICGIGTDKEIFDCVGCLTGEFCKDLNNITVYGTLEYPIHALNVDTQMKDIYEKHNDSFIIGIDACVGKEEDFGNIKLRNIPISPGKGMGKTLTKVGDMSIVSITSKKDYFINRGVRLFDIINMSKVIARIIESLNEKLNK